MSTQELDQDRHVSPLRRVWRKVPTSVRTKANSAYISASRLVGQVRGQLERGGAPHPPICVMGLHRSVLGLGRGARLFNDALIDMNVQTSRWDVSSLLSDDLTLPAMDVNLASTTTVVAHLNPLDHLYALAHYRGSRPGRGFRVGYWAWETTRVPDAWAAGIAAIDEIWCPSQFTADAVGHLVGGKRPIRVVPHPILPGITGIADKKRFGINPDKVTFFAACDLKSSLDRKNPLGAIEAFKRSGCGPRGEAELLIKVHGDYRDSGLPTLIEAAQGVVGVRVIDQKLSPHDMKALRSSIDVVLSPHRSEGFGLVLAEAMHAGKPVIATGWSGNMDFMDAQSAALIESKVVSVVDNNGIYKSGSWAEPDLDHAAALIEWLTRNSQDRINLGLAGMARIRAFSDVGQWQRNVAGLLGLG